MADETQVKRGPGKPKAENNAALVGEGGMTLRDHFAIAALAGGVKPSRCWYEADFMVSIRDNPTKVK